jgi:ABC-2 type transport system ATP-binding protein
MIEAQHLGKQYGNVKAVDDLSFTVRPGQVTGFLGPNGSGKSTTCRLMVGLDHGTGGTTFDGKRFDQLDAPMRHVGLLLEAKAFHPSRTARNHLRMLCAANKIDPKRADECLEMVGLSDVGKRRPKGFSLGMGQRLGLASALLGDPHTLILDEPANGLDPQGIYWLREFLKFLASQGRTVFVSSHLLSEMQLLAEHVVVIGAGKMIADCSTEDFAARGSRTWIVLRSPAPGGIAQALQAKGWQVTPQPDGAFHIMGADLASIGNVAHSAGIPVHELSEHRSSLEEAFIELTSDSQQYKTTLPPGAMAGLAGDPFPGLPGGAR